MNEPFDAKGYAARVMRSKGYMLKRLPDGTYIDTDADVNAVFGLQWPSWKALIEKHRLDCDPEKAEKILTAFGHKEVIGGASKVLETFSKHLDAQPNQGGSPDWSQAGKEWSECAYCDNRGIVSDVPCRVMRHGVPVERKYSFACICRAGERFPGTRKADDWMIDFAIQRKQAEIDRLDGFLDRYGIDPDASPATRAAQFRRAFRGMSQAVGKNGTTAKSVRPPEVLNPEVMALAAYENGDTRNEWE